MKPRQRNSVRTAAVLVGMIACGGMARSARADGATRDLSAYGGPGVTFTVSIAIDPPMATIVAALEETPPTGWVVSSISDSGVWDAGTEEVKWGPLFDPSIPGTVTYDVTAPGEVSGSPCFSGDVTFDTLIDSIGGDQCLGLAIPTASAWGFAAMALLVLTFATLILTKHGSPRGT